MLNRATWLWTFCKGGSCETIPDADVVYENENMETWVPDLLKTLKNKKETVIKAIGKMLFTSWARRGRRPMIMRRGTPEYDPHVWLSPKCHLNGGAHPRWASFILKRKSCFWENAAAYQEARSPLIRIWKLAWPVAKKSFATQHAASTI